MIKWGRVGLGTLEAGAGAAGIAAAAYTEVGSVGVATGVAVSLAGFSVPALSHGVSEIIAGFIETDAVIPPVSAPAVATLAVTGDVNQAQTADFIGNSLMLGGNAASWTTNIPNQATAISAGISFGGLAGQSTTMGSRCGN